MRLFLFFCIGILFHNAVAQSVPQYDTSFNGGTVSTSILETDKSNAVLVQPDKKVILGGMSTEGHIIYGTRLASLVRYNENGSLDMSFGINGVVKLEHFNCTNLTLQNDGKILAGGQSNTKSGIVRLMPDGSLDTNFANNGVFQDGDTTSTVYQIVVLEDGSIFAVGVIINSGSGVNISKIIKLKPNGEPDSSFGNNGIITSQYGFHSVITRRVKLTSDGKFLVGGYVSVNVSGTNEAKLLLMKFNTNGTLDESFGDDGIALHNSSTKSLQDFELTPDGKIVAIGNIDTNSTGTYGDFIVTRFNTDGSLDETFGESNGFTRESFDIYAEYVYNLKILPDNKIYVTGSFWDFTHTSGLLCRFDENGFIDEEFGEDGAFSFFTTTVTGLSSTPDMKLVLTGQNQTSGSNFRAGRLNIDIPFNENDFREIKLTSNPENGGALVGGGYYSSGDTVTVIAYPKPGSVFNNWTDGGNIVSNDLNYNFTVSGNRELAANFTLLTYQITTSSNPVIGGTTTGGGNYYYGEEITLTALPVADYVFVNWTENGVAVSSDPTLTITVETARNLVANFALITYNVYASSFPSNGGTTTGSGNYYFGQTAYLNANANYGYNFLNWTENDEVISTIPNLNVVIESNRTFKANFSLDNFTVLTDSNPSSGGTTSGGGTFPFNTQITLTAIPDAIYEFVNWTDENGSILSNNPVFTTYVWNNTTYTANFERTAYIVTTVANPSGGGTVTSGGIYDIGEEVILYATANTYNGYEFVNWTENGNIISTNPQLTFTINADRNLVANFSSPDLIVSVSQSPADGGTTTGAGIYHLNETVTLTAYPNEGYTFKNWKESGFILSDELTYTFDILYDRNITANFESVMSTNDLELNGISIIPNPFDKIITVRSENNPFDKIELYDFSGRLIKTVQVQNKTDYTLLTNDLDEGVYLLKVSSQNKTQTFKVIKKRI